MSQPKRHAYPSDRQDQYIVRLPDGMRELIKNEAARNFRTMNAEIIYQLSRAYASRETQKADATA